MSVYVQYLNKVIELLRPERINKEDYKKNLANTVVNTVNTFLNAILERCNNYLNSVKRSLCDLVRTGIYDACYEVLVKTKSRLIVDASSPMGWLIDEVGLAWEPIIDAPYIPSSSIKGPLRTALTVLNRLGRVRVDPDAVFGTSAGEEGGRSSLITVTDAFPVAAERNLLKRDVFTPTYAPIEGAEKFREHRAKPVPVQIITVARGVTFKFFIAVRVAQMLSHTALDRIVKYAFEELGIGGKTSSGYGLFEDVRVSECHCEEV